MKKILIFLPLCLTLAHSAYAGFSIGMPGAVIKHVEKLDDKIKKKILNEGVWVLVPGSAAIGTSDFYVMKYEAKYVRGLAISQAAESPWVDINFPSAVAACAALGAGAHLVTIAEAQTINRNIEAQAANWANGVIGSLISAGGGLKRGNVGITNSAGYAGNAAEFGAGRDAKASLILSSGGVIWDWSGNVMEWIYGAGAAGTLGTPGGVTFLTVNNYQYDWNYSDLSQARSVLGPSNASYTNLYGVGMYYDGGDTTNAVTRGGYWHSGDYAGVFAFSDNTPSYVDGSIGFRCAR